MILYVIIFTVICIISIILYLFIKNNKNNRSNYVTKNNLIFKIPSKKDKNVFIYWEGYKYKLIQILHKIIYLHSHNETKYKIYFVNSENLHYYIDSVPSFFNKMAVKHKSDYIRYKLIYKYGGIWLDSDTIVMNDLSSLFDIMKNKEGFFMKENNKIIFSGVFGSRANTNLLKNIIKNIDQVLNKKNEKLGWSDIGSILLNNIYLKDKSIYSNYLIYDGLDNMYPVNFDKCVKEFIEKPYDNYKNLIKSFQPLVVIVNSVYKKLDNMSISEILEGKMTINYFLNKSFENANYKVNTKQFFKTFNCLITTTGRKSLQNMLNSLLSQLTKDDCLTIVFDGHSSIPKFDLSLAKCQVKQYFEPKALGFWGHGARNKYAPLLEKRDFVLHTDDDDKYVNDAFTYLRNICNDEKNIYIALMQAGKEMYGREIKENLIGTPCGIIPYEYNKRSEFLLRRGGDADFYKKLQKLYPKNIVFLDKIIYTVRF